jgi:hypothetical protein
MVKASTGPSSDLAAANDFRFSASPTFRPHLIARFRTGHPFAESMQKIVLLGSAERI